MERDVTVKIRRFDPDSGAPPRFETFKVEREKRMNVLDVIGKIQNSLDPSLAFRHSCRVGVCGSCAMRVNGRNRWTCRAPVEEFDGKVLIIEPLPHYPVIRDLVVDMRPFFEDQQKIIPQFVPAKPKEGPDREVFAKISCNAHERVEIDKHIECITCGSCYGECSLVETNRNYVGPAALNRAFTLIADSREGAAKARLDILNSHCGVWGCHTLFNCTEVCPLGISPTRAIQKLKRKEVFHAFTRFIKGSKLGSV